MSASLVLALCALAYLICLSDAHRHLQELVPHSQAHPHVANEAIVKFKPGVRQKAMEVVLARGDAIILEKLGGSLEDGNMVLAQIRGKNIGHAIEVRL
jgi:hypothetical protein